MKAKKQILKAANVQPMSKATKDRLAIVAKELKGKVLFPEKVARAKETLNKLKSLPI